ncbi:TonB-dependent receptor [bacterium]|nr:TonB-dependent receptor [bacterium]
MRRWVLLSAVFFLCGVHPSALAQPLVDTCALVLEIAVRDVQNALPLENAIAQLNGDQWAYTDAEGRCRFRVCPGSQVLLISHVGCPQKHVVWEMYRDTVFSVDMAHAHRNLVQVVVAERRDTRPGVDAETPAWKTAPDLDLGRRLERSAAGVQLIQTGAAPSKPVLQGLTGNRLLVLHEGVRISGQQWGFDHAPELDPVFAKEVRVLYGSEALWYGPEALGGALWISRGPIRSAQGTEGQVLQSLYTNGWGGKTAFQTDFRAPNSSGFWHRLGWRFGASAWGAGDARAADYLLSNTGKRGLDVHWGMDWIRADGTRQFEVFYDRFQEEFGLLYAAQVGSLTDLERAIEADRPLYIAPFSYAIQAPRQAVVHELLRASGNVHLDARTTLFAEYSRQVNFRDEYDVASVLQPSDLRYAITTHLPEIGVEGRWETSARTLVWKSKIAGLVQANTYQGRFFLPNFQRNGWSAVQSLAWNSAGSTQLNLLLRWDFDDFAVYQNPDGSVQRLDSRFNGPSFSLSRLRSNAQRGTSNRWTVGSVFRPPHVHERYSRGVHHGQLSYEEGDPNLGPERSWEVSWARTSNRALDQGAHRVTLQAYARFVEGYIQIRPTAPILTIRGAYPAFVYDQTQALLLGVDGRYEREYGSGWSAFLHGSLLIPIDASRQTGLFYMPPVRLGWGGSKVWGAHKGEAEAVWTHRAYFAPGEPVDYAPPPPGYVLLRLDYAFRPAPAWELGVRLDNALNTAYRDYLDRFRYFADAPGFNLALRLRYSWDSSRSKNF